MSYDVGVGAIATHTAEALTKGVLVDAPRSVRYVSPACSIASSSQAITFWSGFGFQSAREWRAAVAAGLARRMTESELEQEFAAFADDALDWANLTAGAVPDSWPDE